MESESLASSVQKLVMESRSSSSERIEAIDRLVHAPGDAVWTEAILLAMEADDPGVSDHARKAIERRLMALGDAREQDIFISCILDYCFTRASGETDKQRGILFRTISSFLMKNRGDMEHHLSRVISNARRIQFMRHEGEFSSSVVQFMRDMACKEGRAAAHPSRELSNLRKLHSYRTAATHPSALLAYLTNDSGLPFEDINRELFEVYYELLNISDNTPVLQRALDNLKIWLNMLPGSSEEWSQLITAIGGYRRGALQFENLPPTLQKHIAAHQELLRGTGERGDLDLLNLTFSKFLNEPGLMQAAFELMALLPGLRGRIDVIRRLMNPERMLSQGIPVWHAALRFISSLMIGIDPAEPSREELTDERRRLLLHRKRMLREDAKLRELLYSIAHEEQYPAQVRHEAWRTLLRCVPPERMVHYTKKLQNPDDDLFNPSIQMAGETRERDVFQILLDAWPALIAGDGNTPGRGERIGRVCDAISRMRNFDMVPMLISVALGDPDADVRETATATLRVSGYGLELDREMQRRRLEAWRVELTETSHAVTSGEDRRDNLTTTISEIQLKKADIVSKVQESISEREILITNGWLGASDIQIQLHGIQGQLVQALDEAAGQEAILRQFQEEIVDQLEMIRVQEQDVRMLVIRQNEIEERLRSPRDEMNRLQTERESTRHYLEKARDDYYSERNRNIERGQASDSQENYTLEQQNESELKSHQDNLNRLQREIKNYEDRISLFERVIDQNGQNIRTGENELGGLKKEIERARAENRRLENELGQLRRRFTLARSDFQGTRSIIRLLASKVSELRAKLRDDTIQRQRDLDANAQAVRGHNENLQALNGELRKMSLELTGVIDEVNKHRNRAQSLVQEIQQGRQHYDELGDRARETSSIADGQGITEQQLFITERRQDDEALLHYAHDMNMVPGWRTKVRERQM